MSGRLHDLTPDSIDALSRSFANSNRWLKAVQLSIHSPPVRGKQFERNNESVAIQSIDLPRQYSAELDCYYLFN